MKNYYASHNEVIDEKAKIFIVGITPGWTQSSIAYKTANEGLSKKMKKCRKIIDVKHTSNI